MDPSPAFYLTPAVPGRGRGRHGCLHFIGAVPGLLRGKDTRRALSSPKIQDGWGSEFGPLALREELGDTECLHGSLQTLPILKDPPPSSSVGTGQLWSQLWWLLGKQGLKWPTP